MTGAIRPRTRNATTRPARGNIVLVHGTLDEGGSFRPVLDILRPWDVTYYDRRGWGAASALGPGTLTQNSDDLVAALPPTPSILAGHSYGGTVALTVAGRCPGRVRAVVAYEPALPWLPWWPDLAPWEELVLDVRRTPADAAEAVVRDVLSDAGWERLPSRIRDRRRDEGEVLRTEMQAFIDEEPSFDPLSMACPVVTAAGSDSLPHNRLASAVLAQLVPNGVYREIAGATHPAHVSHPGEFAALIDLADQRANG